MTRGAVASPHHLSAAAGRRVLESGGNAVDAAVAVVAAQGVVAPETSGVGGDLFALVHKPGWERPQALNSSGWAGWGVSARELRRSGHDTIPLDHPAVVTIPGCVDGLASLLDHLGTRDLAEVLAPAIEYAEGGFEVSAEQSSAFARNAHLYASSPATGGFYRDGEALAEGERVSRPDLARTLRAIAADGPAAFYQGAPGEDIVEAVGGSITREDLTRPIAEWVAPIGLEVFGLDAWTIPPNSQGYLGPATLAVFEMLGPPSDPEDPLWWHLLIESYRCLAWERDDVISDPAAAALPADLLLARDRLERAADTVDPARAGSWPQKMGSPSGTAYMCVADQDGLAVSIIQSNYRGIGSPFTARRSGFALHDRGLGFTLTSGHPNELAPGKRPLHTLSPTLWTKAGQPRFLLGTRGGAVQPQLVAQVGARAIGSGMGLDASQSAPRWTVSDFGPYSPPHPTMEPGVPAPTLAALEGMGHQISMADGPQAGWGPVSVIEISEDGFQAAADPRVDTATALVL